MSTITLKLGVSGSETDLPLPCWSADDSNTLPVEYSDGAVENEMADGSLQVAFKAKVLRKWTLTWDGLEAADLATLQTVAALEEELNFISTVHGVTAATVVIKPGDFTHALKSDTYARIPLYTAEMVITEIDT